MLTGRWLRRSIRVSVLAGLAAIWCAPLGANAASPASLAGAGSALAGVLAGQYWVDTSSTMTDRPPGAVKRPWTSPTYLTWGPYAELHNNLNRTIAAGVILSRFIEPTVQRSWTSLYGQGARAAPLGVFTANVYRHMREIHTRFYSYKQTQEPRQKIFASGFFEMVKPSFTYDKAYHMYGAGQLRTPAGQQERYGLHYQRYTYLPGSFVVSRSTTPQSVQPEFTKMVANYAYSPMKSAQPWRGPQLTRLGVMWKWRDYNYGNVSILQPNR